MNHVNWFVTSHLMYLEILLYMLLLNNRKEEIKLNTFSIINRINNFFLDNIVLMKPLAK